MEKISVNNVNNRQEYIMKVSQQNLSIVVVDFKSSFHCRVITPLFYYYFFLILCTPIFLATSILNVE